MRVKNVKNIGLACVAALAVTTVTTSQAALITNGSLTGPIANVGVPTGWSILAGSPDTMDENNNVGGPYGNFQATPSPSPNGGTWVGFARDGSFIEQFGQTVGSLTAGYGYTISWYAANFGYTPSWANPNAIEVLIDGSSIGTGSVRAVSTGWAYESVSFTATSSSHTLSFRLANGGPSYYSIDGIAMVQTQVPEPGAILAMLSLAGCGVGAVVVRRRRAKKLAA